MALVERCVDATGAELVVLPETASTGFTPGIGAVELVDLVPPTVMAPVQDVAARLGRARRVRHVRAGPEPSTVYNTAVLIGPTGEVLGTYRKTHLFAGESRVDGGWVTPGRGGARRRHRAGLDRADDLLRRRLSRSWPG